MDPARATIRQAEIGPMSNFIYLIGCRETGEAAVVDPAWDVPAILKLSEESGLRIRHILLTHGHPDHVNGVQQLLEKTDATLHIHRDEVDYLRRVADFFGMNAGFLEGDGTNLSIAEEGTELLIGRVPVRFVHTPGHTPGSQCFLVENSLVSGDTLFVNACGRVDLPGGDPEKMWWSLNRRLAGLDDSTLLYPGHNYADRNTSSIGEEKRNNPYMRFEVLSEFLEAMRSY
jgi:hydroxyacylglutathione hydrolase